MQEVSINVVRSGYKIILVCNCPVVLNVARVCSFELFTQFFKDSTDFLCEICLHDDSNL